MQVLVASQSPCMLLHVGIVLRLSRETGKEAFDKSEMPSAHDNVSNVCIDFALQASNNEDTYA